MLRDFIETQHELVLPADRMDWDRFDTYWLRQFSDAGGLMVYSSGRVAGMLTLQRMENLSDERLAAVWVTNPYYRVPRTPVSARAML